MVDGDRKPCRDVAGKTIRLLQWSRDKLDSIELEDGTKLRLDTPTTVTLEQPMSAAKPNCVFVEHLSLLGPSVVSSIVRSRRHPVLRVKAESGAPQLFYWDEKRGRVRTATFGKMRIVHSGSALEPGMIPVDPDRLQDLIP